MAIDTTTELEYQTKYSKGIDLDSLEAELHSKIKGEVRFDYCKENSRIIFSDWTDSG